MNPLLGYPPLNCSAAPKLALHDRVRLPGRRVGEVLGFYRSEQDLVLVRLEDGETCRFARADVRLLIS